MTTPIPYSFDSRKKKKTLREKKLEEMLIEHEKEELKELKEKFKAKEIPKNILKPLFYKITKKQIERRELVHLNSVKMTMDKMKPFSFDNREKNKIKNIVKIEEEKTFFKANPIPWYCSVKLMSKKKEEEDKTREERNQTRIGFLNHISKLPPRMAEHQKKLVKIIFRLNFIKILIPKFY